MKTEYRLPYWPAALTRNEAAAYCGMSMIEFLASCPVAPIRLPNVSARERYLRKRLDEWLFSLEDKVQVATVVAASEKSAGAVEPVNFTPKSLSERWHCSERHVRNLIKSSRLRCYRFGGKLIRIPLEFVEDFEREGTEAVAKEIEQKRGKAVDR